MAVQSDVKNQSLLVMKRHIDETSTFPSLVTVEKSGLQEAHYCGNDVGDGAFHHVMLNLFSFLNDPNYRKLVLSSNSKEQEMRRILKRLQQEKEVINVVIVFEEEIHTEKTNKWTMRSISQKLSS